MPKNKFINLLPQEEFDASTLGRTLKWAMSSFRIIVIVTEMVVMAAFLSRFWLDAQNSELDASIKVAVAQISAQSEFEKQFRELQKKLSIFKQISLATTKSSRLNLAAAKVPNDITLTSVTISEESAQIKGNAVSEIGVAQLISNLKSDTLIKKVNLDSVGSSEQTQGLITFLITISY